MSPEILEALLYGGIALLSVLFGWLLARRDDRVAYERKVREVRSRVLADLLEIRHRLITTSFVVVRLREIMRSVNATPEQVAEVLDSLPTGYLWDDKIDDRYTKAIDELAAYQPLSSWVLRGQSAIGSMHRWLLVAPEAKTEEEVEYAQRMSAKIQEKVIPALDDAILGLAESRDKKTEKNVRELLSAGMEPSDDVNEIVTQLREDLQNLQKEQATDARPDQDS